MDVYECGVEGCHKHFQHEHIGMDGEGRDADTLNFLNVMRIYIYIYIYKETICGIE